MADSFDSAAIPLGSDPQLRDRFANKKFCTKELCEPWKLNSQTFEPDNALRYLTIMRSDIWRWEEESGSVGFSRTWTSSPSTWSSSMWRIQDRCLYRQQQNSHHFRQTWLWPWCWPGTSPCLPSVHRHRHGRLHRLHQTSQVPLRPLRYLQHLSRDPHNFWGEPQDPFKWFVVISLALPLRQGSKRGNKNSKRIQSSSLD